MNNQDRFDAAIEAGLYIRAVRLALRFAAGKGSRSGCWSWADQAVVAGKLAGIELLTGGKSWPDLAGMTRQLNAKFGTEAGNE